MGLIRSFYWMATNEGLPVALRRFGNFLYWYGNKYLTSKRYLRLQVEGHTMYLDLREPGISRNLAINRMREKVHTEILREEVTQGMSAIDLGTNIGYNTLLLCDEVGKSGSVYAIEPYPPSFELMEKNVEANGYYDRVETYNVAIADHNGTTTLKLDERSNLHQIDPESDDESGTVDVKCKTLDSLLADIGSVDFIRMDIEGYEEFVLSDDCSGQLLRKHEPKILFEVHPSSYVKMEKVLTSLVEKGYRPKTLVSAGYPNHIPYQNRGYKPDKTVHCGGHTRDIYTDIELQDFFHFLLHEPKCTRYTVISK